VVAVVYPIQVETALKPLDAAVKASIEDGRTYPILLHCKSKEGPKLELETFSGALLLEGSPTASPRYLEPSVPAAWEAEVVDEKSAATGSCLNGIIILSFLYTLLV